ncbi:Scr1 family TA system antitoxin-like transcriptional regulator [Streptomyces crystallinus]|uniref:DUF5753 domain-containing protein n=1 Tax=Streptomyces crystallinus TaxID=68191 RepID=A0ABP3RUF5_9ACTN
MTPTSNDPPVRLLVLGANLTRMRDLWGVSRGHIAAAARVSADALADWESGRAAPPPWGLQRLMRLYRLPPETQRVLAQWAKEASDPRTRHALLDTGPAWEDRLAALELAAVRVRAFSDYTVPTAVRSSTYAQNLEQMRSGTPLGLTDPERRPRPVVTGPHSWEHIDVILHASVLTRPFGSEPGNLHPLADQLAYLCKVARDRLADIRITPVGAGHGVQAEGSDLLGLTMPCPHRSTVWVQTTSGSATYLNGPHGQEHQRTFEELSSRAADLPLSAVLLHKAADACMTRVAGER